MSELSCKLCKWYNSDRCPYESKDICKYYYPENYEYPKKDYFYEKGSLLSEFVEIIKQRFKLEKTISLSQDEFINLINNYTSEEIDNTEIIDSNFNKHYEVIVNELLQYWTIYQLSLVLGLGNFVDDILLSKIWRDDWNKKYKISSLKKQDSLLSTNLKIKENLTKVLESNNKMSSNLMSFLKDLKNRDSKIVSNLKGLEGKLSKFFSEIRKK